jgi:hypothetical protein
VCICAQSCACACIRYDLDLKMPERMSASMYLENFVCVNHISWQSKHCTIVVLHISRIVWAVWCYWFHTRQLRDLSMGGYLSTFSHDPVHFYISIIWEYFRQTLYFTPYLTRYFKFHSTSGIIHNTKIIFYTAVYMSYWRWPDYGKAERREGRGGGT